MAPNSQGWLISLVALNLHSEPRPQRAFPLPPAAGWALHVSFPSSRLQSGFPSCGNPRHPPASLSVFYSYRSPRSVHVPRGSSSCKANSLPDILLLPFCKLIHSFKMSFCCHGLFLNQSKIFVTERFTQSHDQKKKSKECFFFYCSAWNLICFLDFSA